MTDSLVVKELHRIAEAHDGELRPVDVVEAARPARSVLHSKFDWDNTEAAEKWRLHQARNLIRVTVEMIQTGSTEVEARTFVSLHSDREPEGAGYRLLTKVLTDADLRRQLLADARQDMEVFCRRYGRLKELADVIKVLRRAKQKLAS